MVPKNMVFSYRGDEMTEHEMIAELQAAISDLTGDILALECLCCCENCVESFGLAASHAYLQRLESYFDQNMKEAVRLESMLAKEIHRKMLLSAQTGRAS